MKRMDDQRSSRREWMRAAARGVLLAASAALMGVAWTRRGRARPAGCPPDAACGACGWRAGCPLPQARAVQPDRRMSP